MKTTWVGLCLAAIGCLLLSCAATAQGVISPFPASTPGWVAASHISLDTANGHFIDFNADGPVVQVWDVTTPTPGLAVPAIWGLQGFSPSVNGSDGQRRYLWSGRHLGQIFGLAIDDNPYGPYIYAAETAVYGSVYNAAWPSDETQPCVTASACYPGMSSLSDIATRTSHPFDIPPQDGLFAFPSPLPASGPHDLPDPNSHAGAIWRLSLKADLSATYDPYRTYELVALIPTNDMSLGQIAYNPDADTFYVSNFADGLIYIFNNPPVGGPPVTSGFVTYDHGALSGVPPVHGQFTAYGRRIWGLQYNRAEHRLYYAVWNADHRYQRTDGNGQTLNNEIWSVDLDTAGHPINATRTLRLSVPVYPRPLGIGQPPSTLTQYMCPNVGNPTVWNCYSQPVSDIAFNSAGDVMLLAERGERIGRRISGGYDNTLSGVNILAHNSRVLRYRKDAATGQWLQDTANDYGEYSGDGSHDNPSAPAFNGWRTDSSGGVDFGFGYGRDSDGMNTSLDPAAHDQWVWNGSNSGATLGRQACIGSVPTTPACPLVYGLMGAKLPTQPSQPDTLPDSLGGATLPVHANLYFIDLDGDPYSATKGVMGDIEVNRSDGKGPVPDGTLKICKVAGPGTSVGQTFTFQIGQNKNLITVPGGPQPGGWCKPVGTFPGGSTQHVSETPQAGFGVVDIRVEPSSALAGLPNLAGGAVDVTIMPGGVTEVTFTNTAGRKAIGYLEVCKTSNAGGTFGFNVDGYGAVTVPAGACSSPLMVAAGPVTITETTPGYKLTACSAAPVGRQGACDTAHGASTVTVVAGGPSAQTIATLTNVKCPSVGRVTLCDIKVVDGAHAFNGVFGPPDPPTSTSGGQQRGTDAKAPEKTAKP